VKNDHYGRSLLSRTARIKTEIDVTRAQLSRNGIEVLTGLASFTGPNGLRVSGVRGQADYQAEKVIIATGTKPASSPLVPFNNRNIINSDQNLQMPQIPKTMIVVGGGVICGIHLHVRRWAFALHS
jgi:NAD(P) transhydrogenase